MSSREYLNSLLSAITEWISYSGGKAARVSTLQNGVSVEFTILNVQKWNNRISIQDCISSVGDSSQFEVTLVDRYTDPVKRITVIRKYDSAKSKIVDIDRHDGAVDVCPKNEVTPSERVLPNTTPRKSSALVLRVFKTLLILAIFAVIWMLFDFYVIWK
ncbi:MAG: hypothetical protein JSS82_07875 [Bacteroidetes bacterium]|nr:hypothetical protein [Bacteroidota bacterium]